MAIGEIPTRSTESATPADGTAHVESPGLRPFVFALFFIMGGVTSLNDIIIPKLKDLFALNFAQGMLIQTAFFGAYLLVSLPAAAVVARSGYMRTAVFGLLTIVAGALLLIPAANTASYPIFLFAYFVFGAGITAVQVVCNPLISLLGRPDKAHSRLTFAQAFNSLGTVIFPYVGAILILGSIAKVDQSKLSGAALDAYRAAEAQVVSHGYLGLAAALALVAAIFWLNRKRLNDEHVREPILRALTLLRRPRFAWGTACIFLYVGAEVSIGSLIVNYLEGVMGMDPLSAGKHVPYYWGGALVGRILGSGILYLIRPGKVLAAVATGAIALILVSANSHGAVSGWTLLSIGLMNSIMFPTIFSLASEGLGARAAEGSGIIATAIVGGAIVPPLTGMLADAVGLHLALALPAACYAVILAFGLYARVPGRGS